MGKERHVAIMNFHGDPNIGMYGLATDKFCLIGKGIKKSFVEEIEEVLKVPVFQISLYGTNLISLFAIGNSKAVIVPDIIFEEELKNLKDKMKDIGINVITIHTNHTAIGNNILVNDKTAVVSSLIEKDNLIKIEKELGVKVNQIDIGGISIPGSIGVITNNGGIFNPNIDDKEITQIEKLLGFEIGLGTINMGNPFLSSGVIANSKGFIVGKLSSGFEIARVDESLGFLN